MYKDGDILNNNIIKTLKIILVLCLLILIIEVIYAFYKINNKKEKTIYFEGINSLVVSNKVYATVGSNNDNDNHYEKAKISKFNSKKEKTFEKLYNVGFNSVFFGVLSDDDMLVTVGNYEKTKEERDNHYRRALIVKYDSDGNVLFENDLKKLDYSKYNSIKKYNDDYIVTGQTIYSNTRIGNKEGGAVLVRYDKELKPIWIKNYGDNKSASFNDCFTYNDYIYVVGVDNYNTGILLKYDMDGNLVNKTEYSNTDNMGFTSIVIYKDYIFIVGSKVINDNNTDALIVKYNLDLEFISEVSYDNIGNMRFNKIIIDSHENIVTIGSLSTYSKNSSNKLNNYDYDSIIAKYNTDLEKIKVVIYGDNQDDYFTDIKEDNDNYLVVGYSSYEDGSYMSKIISYSKALKVLEVNS